MTYCLVEGGIIKEGPKQLPNGWRNISGLDKATPEHLATLGWLPVVETDKAYDPATHTQSISYAVVGGEVIGTRNNEAIPAIDIWKARMASFTISRVEEEVIGTMSNTQKAKLPQYTRDAYAAKVTLRGEKP